MLTIKHSVNLAGVRPEIVLAIVVAQQVYSAAGHECVITAALDGPHTAHSLHGLGFAIDVRTKNVPQDQWACLTERIQECLNNGQYDVVLEKDHIHIEFDPR